MVSPESEKRALVEAVRVVLVALEFWSWKHSGVEKAIVLCKRLLETIEEF